MHLIRTLLVCLACLSAALLPSRAAACPMQMRSSAQMHAAMPLHRHHQSCPSPMTCCVPMAAHPATPPAAPSRVALRRPPALVLRDRIGEDAARIRLLRPPTSA